MILSAQCNNSSYILPREYAYHALGWFADSRFQRVGVPTAIASHRSNV